jgi:hypothetical protein
MAPGPRTAAAAFVSHRLRRSRLARIVLREEHVRARLVGVYRNVHAAVVRRNEKRAETGALVLERRRRLRTRPTHDGS